MSDAGRMKALVCRQLGNPLSKDDRKPLQLTSNFPKQPALLPPGSESSTDLCNTPQVRIRVVAAALNFADALQLQGLYQEKPKLPFIPGSEVSGRIIEVGSDVRTVSVGDSVCAVSSGGAFAEELVVKETAVFKLPQLSDLAAAAGLPVAFGTAHLALRERAQLKAGQTVLVLGAAGGVGTAAVQISKVLGARVVAVARGKAKAVALTDLGADVVIDSSAHKEEPLRKLIKAAAPRGIDVVLDPVGGTALNEALKCVRWGAQILFIGFASGHIPKVAANIALVKNMTLHGIFWGSYLAQNPKIIRKGLQELVTWLGEEKIFVPVSHRFSFEEATEAFRILVSREVIGKVILQPNLTTSKL